MSPDSRFWKAALVLVGEALIYYDEQMEMLRSYAVQERIIGLDTMHFHKEDDLLCH